MNFGVLLQYPVSSVSKCRYAPSESCRPSAAGCARYPGSRSYSVGLSVDPWIEQCPRIAMIPPPGLPIFPSSSWRMPAARIICTPMLCCVHPSA
jgi:hypothetical protein